MRKSTKYLMLIILNALLIIGWPISLWLVSPVSTLTAFLVGVIWASDIYDLIHHICYYMEAKIEEM